jgi:hypothetical protein
MGLFDFLSPKRKQATDVFVLGAGFEPSTEAELLRSRFVNSNPNVDFSVAPTHTAAISDWSGSTPGTVVVAFAMHWFPLQGRQCDPKRILFNDYYNDMSGKAYIVAVYVV